MKAWVLNSDSEHDIFAYVNSKEARAKISEFRFHQMRIDGNWNPLEIRTLEKMGRNSSYHSELLLPVIDDKAAKILHHLLRESDVELLSLLHIEGQYWGLNFPHLLDCIDVEKSIFTLFSDGGVMEYKKFAFHESVITNSGFSIFRAKVHDMEKLSTGHTFVTSRFKDLVEQSGLVGFKFTEVWDSNQ